LVPENTPSGTEPDFWSELHCFYPKSIALQCIFFFLFRGGIIILP